MPNDKGNPNDEIRKTAEVVDAFFNLSFVIPFVIRYSCFVISGAIRASSVLICGA